MLECGADIVVAHMVAVLSMHSARTLQNSSIVTDRTLNQLVY